MLDVEAKKQAEEEGERDSAMSKPVGENVQGKKRKKAGGEGAQGKKRKKTGGETAAGNTKEPETKKSRKKKSTTETQQQETNVEVSETSNFYSL